jgi:chemotaxis methyl-accepting protein methylase/PAS domain-containing protein
MKKIPPTRPIPRQASAPDGAPGESDTRAGRHLMVVGIGCSAGGLAALKDLLADLPADCRAALVVVQHMDPDHASALVELLQTVSPLPVVGISDGLALRPGVVHVIPQGMDLAVQGGGFHLTAMARSAGARLPIDPFFRSLAEAFKEQAVGVILSGMGSDGTEGLRAIKEHGGFTLAQDPATAEADDMPRGAIQAGVVDVVAAAGELGDAITRRLKYGHEPAPGDAGTDGSEALDEILGLLRNRSGNDFSLYKVNYLTRRFERRLVMHRLQGLAEYAAYLRSNAEELDLLSHELLIGVTQFFRDPEIWDELRDKVFPELFARHPGGANLRAWVPACSTGEEAYSLAMVFREALARSRPEAWFTLRIFATDLGRGAIEQARKGVFPESIARTVGPSRLKDFFAREADGSYRVLEPIREMVIFAHHNLLSDPIFSGVDFLCCRNLLIYFGAALKERTLRLLCHALSPGGFLLLGGAESVGQCEEFLVPVNRKHRLFRRAGTGVQWMETLGAARSPVEPAPRNASHPEKEAGVIERIANEMIWKILGAAAVVVNAEGDILHVRGPIGDYLEPAAGKTNLNIHAMARGELAKILAKGIPEAVASSRPVFLPRVPLGGASRRGLANVSIRQVEAAGAARDWVLVCFEGVPDRPVDRPGGEVPADSGGLQEELVLARDALLLAQEERQEAREELRSSNEELRALNEELATSKEELQSLNEEQLTINVELQAKVDELAGARDDLVVLLDAIEIATLFVGGDLKLRRFNRAATTIFRLLPNDVGRPLSHVASNLDYPEFVADIERVIGSETFLEKEARTRDGLCFRVRITPYGHPDPARGGGVVVSFMDITQWKKLEAELQARSSRTD